MAHARYYFRTSNLNWRMGIASSVGAAAFGGVGWLGNSRIWTLLVMAGCLAAVSVVCFLARYSLTIDVQAGHVRDTAGIWPFARTRYEWVSDFRGLEITYPLGSGGPGHYTLWLLANDGRRISLADWDTWPKLNDVAQERSQATGWPVTDTTNGRYSLSALLRG